MDAHPANASAALASSTSQLAAPAPIDVETTNWNAVKILAVQHDIPLALLESIRDTVTADPTADFTSHDFGLTTPLEITAVRLDSGRVGFRFRSRRPDPAAAATTLSPQPAKPLALPALQHGIPRSSSSGAVWTPDPSDPTPIPAKANLSAGLFRRTGNLSLKHSKSIPVLRRKASGVLAPFAASEAPNATQAAEPSPDHAPAARHDHAASLLAPALPITSPHKSAAAQNPADRLHPYRFAGAPALMARTGSSPVNGPPRQSLRHRPHRRRRRARRHPRSRSPPICGQKRCPTRKSHPSTAHFSPSLGAGAPPAALQPLLVASPPASFHHLSSACLNSAWTRRPPAPRGSISLGRHSHSSPPSPTLQLAAIKTTLQSTSTRLICSLSYRPKMETRAASTTRRSSLTYFSATTVRLPHQPRRHLALCQGRIGQDSYRKEISPRPSPTWIGALPWRTPRPRTSSPRLRLCPRPLHPETIHASPSGPSKVTPTTAPLSCAIDSATPSTVPPSRSTRPPPPPPPQHPPPSVATARASFRSAAAAMPKTQRPNAAPSRHNPSQCSWPHPRLASSQSSLPKSTCASATTFFYTYRAFMTPLDLLELLILRFEWAISDPTSAEDEARRRIVRVRTYVVIKHWLQHHFDSDFLPNRALRQRLAAWLNAMAKDERITSRPADMNIVNSLRKIVRALKQTYSQSGVGGLLLNDAGRLADSTPVRRKTDSLSTFASSSHDSASSSGKHMSVASNDEHALSSSSSVPSTTEDVNLDFSEDNGSHDAPHVRSPSSDHQQQSPAAKSSRMDSPGSSLAARKAAAESVLVSHRHTLAPATFLPPRAAAGSNSSSPAPMPHPSNAWSRAFVHTVGRLSKFKRVLGNRGIGMDSANDLEAEAEQCPRSPLCQRRPRKPSAVLCHRTSSTSIVVGDAPDDASTSASLVAY
ncbi:hypothetical protein L1887_44516 [Cichorium endivia]|nr:hypothetical protein L1887_44516 [Cichorium endivia]